MTCGTLRDRRHSSEPTIGVVRMARVLPAERRRDTSGDNENGKDGTQSAFVTPRQLRGWGYGPGRPNERESGCQRFRSVPGSSALGKRRKAISAVRRASSLRNRPHHSSSEIGRTVLGESRTPCGSPDLRVSKTSLASSFAECGRLARLRVVHHGLRCLKNSTCRSRLLASSRVSYGPLKVFPSAR